MHAPISLKHILLVGVLVAAGLLRLYALDASSLWSDEGNTWALLAHDFAQIARAAAADIHPPGYYWLLKVWSGMVGARAWAMRSLSALLGVLLVYGIYRIGHDFAPRVQGAGSDPSRALYGLLAALVAALHPLHVYYSQEARMYMLLTLAGALLFWALLALIRSERASVHGVEPQQRQERDQNKADGNRTRGSWLPALLFTLAGVAGLWTHYSFPILLAAAGLVYLLHWCGQVMHVRETTRPTSQQTDGVGGTRSVLHNLLRFGLCNGLILLAFWPWLPTAVTQVRNWPKGGETVPLLEGLRLTLHTLTFGPLRNVTDPQPVWLILGGLLPLTGALALYRLWRAERTSPSPNDIQPLLLIALLTWLLAPVLLMFGLGLFSDAFLKFLLAAAPAWCLLVAAVPYLFAPGTGRILSATVVGAAAAVLAVATLPGYYTDPAARDNYAGVARYLAARDSDSAADLVVLNAPGQRDVWSYYDPGLPVLALPRQRPPDPQQTESLLAAETHGRDRLFALFWATDESDPQGIVESWLDRHAFKGLESWQGNVRFVTYNMPGQLECRALEPTPVFDARIALVEQCQPAFPQRAAAGDVALVGLRWRGLEPLAARYKVTVQLLDARNQVVAQRDGEPGGGSAPTSEWRPGVVVTDNHGIPIPPGTPPDRYRLIAALYDPTTGARLTVAGSGHVELGAIQVVRPASPLPPAVWPIMHRTDARLGPVWLVGYDVHRKGYAHAPETPVQTGDVIHYTLFWQAPDPLPPDWPADLHFTLHLGEQTLTAPLAGGAYPTAEWQGGEFIRGEFDVHYADPVQRAVLRVADGRHNLRLPLRGSHE